MSASTSMAALALAAALAGAALPATAQVRWQYRANLWFPPSFPERRRQP